ncbi:hypothetical protein MTO96_048785 [Rhipicephalus appendiculatus]
MKFSSAIVFCALLAAFLALTTAAEERSGKWIVPEGAPEGCPWHNGCLRICKKKGYTVGKCVPIVNVCVCM